LLPVIWESRWSQSHSAIICACAAAFIAISRVHRLMLTSSECGGGTIRPQPYEGSFNC
jgi:hypothetical protein